MQNKKIYGVAAAIGAFVGLGALVTSSAFAGAPPTADDYDLSILNAPSTTADTLPMHLDTMIGDGDIEKDSLQELATTEEAQYFSAMNDSGELCLVVSIYTSDKDWGIATSCSAPSIFNAHGVGLVVETATTAVEGYLVPDTAAKDIDLSKLGSAGEIVDDNLVLVDTSASESDRDQVSEALVPVGISLIPAE